LAGLLPLRGQETKAAEVGAEQKLIQALFESEDAPSIASAIAAARKGKVADQAILEAQFLFLIDQQDFKAVAALAPVLEKQRAAFRIDDSVIFSIPEEFFAIIEYCHALEALERGDDAEFKTRITEAFWLSPRQATAFAPHIERLRQEKIIAKLKIDQTRKFALQDSGKLVSLATLAGNSKCHVVHFWSPWSEQCEANLPDFIAMTEELARNKIPVTSVMIETGAEALTAAKEFRAGIKTANFGNWIVDNSKTSLARKLRAVELPTVALLTREGGVLFSGHPSDGGFWNALTKIAPKVKRPHLDPER
jgi:hypothetical protein